MTAILNQHSQTHKYYTYFCYQLEEKQGSKNKGALPCTLQFCDRAGQIAARETRGHRQTQQRTRQRPATATIIIFNKKNKK